MEREPDLRELRVNAGKTQEDTASFLGVTQTGVSQWEYGRAPFPEAHASLLARFLGLEAGEIRRAARRSRERWLADRDMRLAQHLRLLRENGQLTREDVAAAADVSSGAVTLWEEGVSRPSPERMELVAELFEQDPEGLLADAGLGPDEIEAHLAELERALTPLAVLLRAAREEAGLSQQQVATAVGISQNTVSAIELSHHMPNASVLASLQSLFRISEMEIRSAVFQTRLQNGQVPDVTLPWPVDPNRVPRARWFRQVRAHRGLTTSELADELGVSSDAVRKCEHTHRVELPGEILAVDVVQKLASLGGTTVQELVKAYEPDRSAGLEDLLEAEGRALVESCATVSQLVRILNLRGVSWTEMGQTVGTSRQSPINWANGSRPHINRTILLADFVPGATGADLEDLWHRDRSGAGPLQVRSDIRGQPPSGTPEAIFTALEPPTEDGG